MNKIRKIYVLDTSVVIEDPDVFSKFSDVDIIIPTAVVKEIDGLKKNPKRDETRAMAARMGNKDPRPTWKRPGHLGWGQDFCRLYSEDLQQIYCNR